jgi:predicted nucleic acid-binding protein
MPSRFTQYVIDTNILRPLTDGNDELHAIVHGYYDATFKECIWIPDIAVVESLRGQVNSIRDGHSDKVAKKGYELFRVYFHFLRQHRNLEFNDAAVLISKQLKSRSGPKGTRDRRIAASALARGYHIVTRNTQDFIDLGVPGSMLVNWAMDPNFGKD